MAATYSIIVFSLLLVFSTVYRRLAAKSREEDTMRMTRRRPVAHPPHPDPLRHLVGTPVIWTFLTSFKPESKIFSTQIKLIDDPTLENYTDLLTRGDFVAGASIRCSWRA